MTTRREQDPTPRRGSDAEFEALYGDLRRVVLAEEEAQERREDAYRAVAERARAASLGLPARKRPKSTLPLWGVAVIVALVTSAICATWAAYR
jgi:hypothetical protein